jgi:hypothetical protein
VKLSLVAEKLGSFVRFPRCGSPSRPKDSHRACSLKRVTLLGGIESGKFGTICFEYNLFEIINLGQILGVRKRYDEVRKCGIFFRHVFGLSWRVSEREGMAQLLSDCQGTAEGHDASANVVGGKKRTRGFRRSVLTAARPVQHAAQAI